MSNQPPQTIHYSAPAPLSKIALAAFILSLFSFFTCFTLIIPLIALFFGLYALRFMDKSPRILAGRGFADHAAKLGFVSFLLGIVVLLCLPSLGSRHHLSNRSYCAANLRGILQSMNIYASANADSFPLVTYAPYSRFTPSSNIPSAQALDSSEIVTRESYFAAAPNQPGSIPASLWILVLNNQVSPKQFLCKTDPFASKTPAAITDASKNYFDNFQAGNQFSYSAAYPWAAGGHQGGWWKSITDSSLPLMADMTPEQSTGTPPRILNPASLPANAKTWNSANHAGDGQNVGFSDAHVEWTRRPDVGINSDNIYSTSGLPSTGPTQFNGLPAGKYTPQLGNSVPYDILLLPTRNATTGAL